MDPNKYSIDKDWIEKTDFETLKKQEALELQLNSYRTNGIRDGIRVLCFLIPNLRQRSLIFIILI